MLDITHGTFEGPLDLLLQLIEQEKLEITEVSLAQVTDDYIRLLAQLAGVRRAEELADFLVVSAKLILIKSRSLLPSLQEGEEDEIRDFQRQLKIYREFQHAAKGIESLYAAGYVAFPRQYAASKQIRMFLPPKLLTSQMLAAAFASCASKQIAAPRLRGISFDERISIQDKMEQIQGLLSRRMKCYFHHIIQNSASKTDIIVSFLALLELMKQRVISATQKHMFDEIFVQSTQTSHSL